MKLRVAALYSKQKPPHRLLLQTDGEAHYCHCSLSFLLLNHDLGLCPSSFTFGKAQTSLAFHSLNHDLFTIDNIHTLLGVLHLLTLHVVDTVVLAEEVCSLVDAADTCSLVED